MSDMPMILFVDDEENVLKAVSRHFMDEPYDIHTANSGKAALEFMEKNPVPVLISDFRMPEMSGAELLREVAQRWPDTVRIVLSGYADITALITAINEGEIFKFVTKPWRENELKDAVRDALQKYQSQEEMRRLAERALAATVELFDKEQEIRQKGHERNVALEKASEEKQLYEAAFEAVEAPMIVFDAAGEVFAINHAARIQLNPKPVHNQPDSEIIPSMLHEAVRQMISCDTSHSGLLQLSTANGSKLEAKLSLLKGSPQAQGVVVCLFAPAS